MAKRKTSVAQGFQPIPTANIPRDPAMLARVGEMTIAAIQKHEQAVAEREAKSVIEHVSKGRKRGPTGSDIKAVNGRMWDVAQNLIAIHRLAFLASDVGAEDSEALLTLVRESARSSARAIDLCMKRLDPEIAMIGCFDDELSPD